MNSRDHQTTKLKRKKYLPHLQKIVILSTEDKGLLTEDGTKIRIKK